MISFNKFWDKCKEKGISTYYLRNHGIGAPTVTKLRANGNIDMVTLSKLCALLECQPGEILQYTQDTDKE